MSFLSERKDEIIEQQLKSSCCRRALLSGVLFSKGYYEDGKICLRIDGANILEFVSSLISEIYSAKVEYKSSKCGGRGKIIAFYAPAAERYLNSLKVSDTPSFATNQKCKGGCASAFLRGVLLAA